MEFAKSHVTRGTLPSSPAFRVPPRIRGGRWSQPSGLKTLAHRARGSSRPHHAVRRCKVVHCNCPAHKGTHLEVRCVAFWCGVGFAGAIGPEGVEENGQRDEEEGRPRNHHPNVQPRSQHCGLLREFSRTRQETATTPWSSVSGGWAGQAARHTGQQIVRNRPRTVCSAPPGLRPTRSVEKSIEQCQQFV